MRVSCRGTGQQWPATGAEALGAADLGMTYTLLEEVAINTTIGLSKLTQDWGNRLLEGRGKKKKIKIKTTLVCTRTKEKKAVTPQETNPDLPMSVQESLAEAWVGCDLLQGWVH